MMNTVLLTRKHEAVVCELFSELARTRAALICNRSGFPARLQYVGVDMVIPVHLVAAILSDRVDGIIKDLATYGIVIESESDKGTPTTNPATAEAENCFIDPRDGRFYRTVRMPDGKVWMAENLGYEIEGSWCYGNDEANGKKYDRLYTWEAAKKACPPGWHLPTREEWGALAIAAGGTGTYGDVGTVGKKLKSTSGWKNNGNGTDAYGFAALPGGYRYTGGSFHNAGINGDWWTATESGSEDAYYRGMYYNYDNVYENASSKSNGFSVRCVGDEVPA